MITTLLGIIFGIIIIGIVLKLLVFVLGLVFKILGGVFSLVTLPIRLIFGVISIPVIILLAGFGLFFKLLPFILLAVGVYAFYYYLVKGKNWYE